ncbi:bro-e [Mamestra brassicae multiple nucleopolyhedrovirus]|uniref:Bro-e n=1 Tax=Mamestra brassicae nuclear polyhedrosis virus TaxID=78219 RepID=I3XMD1_NPVMB|nr:bro-e [Mamestra brassicae multiple nucleopolyhedrovirus]AFL64964.1 bro-e [Mamestra brassicae multiple nucleopolyhedrovirus]WRQ96687.1 bro-f [Mamestra configurata nucleopolyhedrovirus B]WRQ96848.1 bro-f [Mamestra configurata nucleopolyhedrovirus B]WRQ97009.1 bro-f [Mamestra configurata nucleopolyhedrovirus B]
MALCKQTFYLNNKPVEVKFIKEDLDNDKVQFWFAASEFARCMGYQRPDNIILQKIDLIYRKKFEEFNILLHTSTHPHTVFVNKAGLVQMITKCKLKNADKLQKWLYEEVFPKIDGSFIEDAAERLNNCPNTEIGVFYVVSNEQYHERNLYKIGKTVNISKRINQLNCGRAKYDVLKLLFHSPPSIHYAKIERDMKLALHEYQDNGEVYCVPLQVIFDNLRQIINKYSQT